MDPISAFGLVIGMAGVALAMVSSTISYLQSRTGRLEARLNQSNLSMSAYANAVGSLVALKQSFAANPDVFEEQIARSGITDAIPISMQDDTQTFLLFAAGMWRCSYIYSIVERWEELGLTASEREGLRRELLLWLQGLEGFYEVYQSRLCPKSRAVVGKKREVG